MSEAPLKDLGLRGDWELSGVIPPEFAAHLEAAKAEVSANVPEELREHVAKLAPRALYGTSRVNVWHCLACGIRWQTSGRYTRPNTRSLGGSR